LFVEAGVSDSQQNCVGVGLWKSFGQERTQAWTLAQQPFDPAPLKFDRGLLTVGALGGLTIPFQQMADENGEPALEGGLLPLAQIFYFFHKSRNVDLRELTTTQQI
jgi:hypothetical protein